MKSYPMSARRISGSNVSIKLCLAIAFSVAGCSRASPPTNVPPFDQLRVVALRMSVKELTQVRRVEHVGYVGYIEHINGGLLLYHVSGTRWHDDTEAAATDRLRAIEFQQPAPQKSGASRFRERVAEVQSVLGKASCQSRVAAVWNRKGARIVVTYQDSYVSTFFQSKRGDVSNVARSACR